MLKKLKDLRNDKKGFTLVELIVVLVILAILAALLIPSLTGYINKAKAKQVVAETRQVVMAAQTLVDEAYSAGGGAVTYDKILELAEVKGKGTIQSIKVGNAIGDASPISGTATDTEITVTAEKGLIIEVKYKQNSGKECTYSYDATTKQAKYE